MARRSGVLMNISSLPSPYGIGVMGREARAWCNRIADMGFGLWQILPTLPIGEGNSPYASPSAFAGNVLYVDPEQLLEVGLITEREHRAAMYTGSPYTVDYAFVKEQNRMLLTAAFARADESLLEQVRSFGEKRPHIKAYCLYMAIKEKEGGKPFWEWSDGTDYKSAVENEKLYEKETTFHLFCQYIFYSQWASLKEYAGSKGIKIFGDMPIYVSLDSADLWSRPELFKVSGKKARPKEVAGVPPDYFSEEGQLWGNPLYDWAAMKKDGFSWWKERIEASFELYDVLRIDHFRAFASYWAVPAGAKSAKEGVWKKGPGMALFKAVGKTAGEIIAEDLGEFGMDVVKLLEDTGFPGMRVVQFGFDGSDSAHLPHNYEKNSVAYVGTHDNNTLLGWLWEMGPEERNYALEYCGADKDGWGRGGKDAPACRRIIETVWRSASDTAIISYQDMCGYGSDTRMNVPGVAEDNWRYRTTVSAMNEMDSGYYKWLNKTYKR